MQEEKVIYGPSTASTKSSVSLLPILVSYMGNFARFLPLSIFNKKCQFMMMMNYAILSWLVGVNELKISSWLLVVGY